MCPYCTSSIWNKIIKRIRDGQPVRELELVDVPAALERKLRLKALPRRPGKRHSAFAQMSVGVGAATD